MYLGIDIGTTATKAVLLDALQQPLAQATATYSVATVSAGVSEIAPQEWLHSVAAALAQLRANAPEAYAQTKAIGLSGQMHSLVLLGQDQKPVCPAVLWNDTRGCAEARALHTAIPRVAQITGVVPTAGFTAAKLLWLRHHRPDCFTRIRYLLWPKDFVRHWLAGVFVSDYSDAAGGQLLDEAHWQWSAAVLDYLELKKDCLPQLVPGAAVSGYLQPDKAALLGLAPGIPIAGGAADTAATALGLGCIHQGKRFISLGTGTLYALTLAHYQPQPLQLDNLIHTFAHCVPQRWYSMAAMLNGTSVLRWLGQLLGVSDTAGMMALVKQVEALGHAPGKVLFQPYLCGERTPHNDVQARAAFVGMDTSCTALELVRSALQSVAFSLRQAQDLLEQPCWQQAADSVLMVGGGTRSRYWVQIIANALERPVDIVHEADYIAALGAARLGMVATGDFTLQQVAYQPRIRDRIVPQSPLVKAYAQRYQDFLGLYAVLKSINR